MTICTMDTVTVRKTVANIPFVDAGRKTALIEHLERCLEVNVDNAADAELPGLKEADFHPLFQQSNFSRRDGGVVVTHLIKNVENTEVRQLREEVKLLNQKVEQLSIIQTIQATVDGDALSYSTGKVTVKRDPKFVKAVYLAYGYSKNQLKNNKKLWCPVLGATVPKGAMAVGHIFKHEFHRSVRAVMGFADIDDLRNGMPMFKPIEVAFDSRKLCILYEADDERFVTHVLDPNLMSVTFGQRVQELFSEQQNLGEDTAQQTFASIHGKEIQFKNDFRPYKRTLYYHAMQSRKLAIAKGWISEGWTFEDFSSEGYHRVSIKAWLNKAELSAVPA